MSADTDTPEAESADATESEPVSLDAIIDRDELDVWLNIVNAVCEEARIHVSPTGLRVSATDSVNAFMVESTLGAKAFESYEATGHTALGLSIDTLRESIAMGEKGSLVYLSYDPETSVGHLTVEAGRFKRDMAMIATSAIREDPPSSDIDFAGVVTFDGALLKDVVKAARLVSNHVEIIGRNGDEMLALATGDTDKTTLELTEELDEAEIPNYARSLFSTDYLRELSGGVPKDTQVELRFGNEFPMEVAFEHEGGKTSYKLAPHIEAR